MLVTGLALAYFSRTTTDRQLAQSSYNDTSADLLARSALDITVSDLKQEIANNPTVTHSQYSAITVRRSTDHRSDAHPESDPAQFLGRPYRAGLPVSVLALPRRTGARSVLLVGTAIT